jgi:hypothetical protein
MTKDDIIRMANKAGLYTHKDVQPEILAFAALVAAHKAEIITAEAYRCGYKDGTKAAAIVCENVDKSTHPADLAAAIRARGNT